MNSYWKEETKKHKEFEKISKDIEVDICIIGGGLTGLTAGYYLSSSNKKVAVIEKNRICGNTSGGTTGKITSQHGLIYKYLYDSKGEEFAIKYLKANEEAIQKIEEIIKKENIECDFEKESAYVYTKSEEEIEKIKQEVEVVNKIGGKAKFKEEINLPINILGAIEFENQAKFHPIKYAYGLCNKIIKNKGKIFENSKVRDIKFENKKYVINANNSKILANIVIIATRYPIKNNPGYYFLKMYQSSSFSIIADTKTKLNPGMYINNETKKHSFRVIKDGEKQLLQVVGYDYKTGKQEHENGYIELENLVYKMYPKSEIVYKWTTQDCITLDKIPYIGKFSNLIENMYVATGFNKWGMTSSNLAAKIISDEILGKENEYINIFKSTRMEPIKNKEEVKNMIKEGASSIVLKNLEMPQEEIEEVKTGEGKIINYKGEKVGIYIDEKSKIYKVKPICTHLGCELSFNNIDKTWDCPCHGSRFTYEGKSIEVPSIKNLEREK